MIARIAAAASLSLMLAGAVAAQTNTTTPSAEMSKPSKVSSASSRLAAAGANTTGHSAAAVDCSKQADAKGLHGQARAKFRLSCKAAAKKG